jgi:hypothetical protein
MKLRKLLLFVAILAFGLAPLGAVDAQQNEIVVEED